MHPRTLLHTLRGIEPFTRVLLPLLVFAVVWKGGKSLETTWLLTGAAWMTTMFLWDRKRREHAAHLPWTLWATLIGFLAWSTLAMVFSTTPNYGLDELLRDASLALIFLACVRRVLRADHAMCERFVVTLASVAGIAACIGLVVYVQQPVNRFVGTFFDYRFHTDYWPNAWAQFLLISWPMAAWWAAQQPPAAQGKRSRMLGLLLTGLLLGALSLSYSRGAMIAFAGQIAVAVVLLLPRQPKMRSVLSGAALACGVAVMVFAGANALRSQTFPLESVAAKITFTADEGGSSVHERRAFWGDALAMASEHPIVGWGPYSFRFIQTQFQDAVLATSDHPHNLVLKYAAERGWPAAILFLAFLTSIAWIVLPRLRHPDTMTLALALGVAGVFAHNMIDFNMQFVGIALPWWMALGCFTGMALRHRPHRDATGTMRRTEILLSVAVVSVAVLETPPMILSSFGRHSELAGNDAAALTWYSAANTQILSRDMALSRTQILLRRNRLEEAKRVLDGFQRRNREDPRAWSIHSDLAEAMGDDAVALAAQKEAYRRNTWNDIGVLARLIRLRMDAGEDLSAEEDAYMTVLRKFADAVDHNVHFIALGPNPEAFQEAAKAIAAAYPHHEPEAQILAARVARRAAEEREKLSARIPGRLW